MTRSDAPEVGDRAPEFRLRRSFKESVSLSDLLADGPLLLAFYVFDFGPV
jgi:peroxiredoxin